MTEMQKRESELFTGLSRPLIILSMDKKGSQLFMVESLWGIHFL